MATDSRRASSKRPVLSLALTLQWALFACTPDAPELSTPLELQCHIGAWRVSDGRILTVLPSSRGLLALAFDDGRRGVLYAENEQLLMRDGYQVATAPVLQITLPGCSSGAMVMRWLDEHPMRELEASKLALVETNILFESHGTQMQGRLILPQSDGPWPLVVVTHGSERNSALDHYDWQYALPANDIAAFVYDKRGTGASDGDYTQDFFLLSDDAIAALGAVMTQGATRFSSIGFMGGSQGAWIAPLAASKSPVDFVVALYGFAESALAEDREEVADELRRKGYRDNVLSKAREVTDATGSVIASDFTQGFEALAAVKEKYGEEPWFEEINGEFTGDLLRNAGLALRIFGPWFDLGTSWEYDPSAVLTELTAEQLWVLAAEDTEAPNRETKKRLLSWQAQGRPIDVAVYPGTEHGMWEFVVQNDERIVTRHAFGYARLLAHWIKHRNLRGDFGNVELYGRMQARAERRDFEPLLFAGGCKQHEGSLTCKAQEPRDGTPWLTEMRQKP